MSAGSILQDWGLGHSQSIVEPPTAKAVGLFSVNRLGGKPRGIHFETSVTVAFDAVPFAGNDAFVSFVPSDVYR